MLESAFGLLTTLGGISVLCGEHGFEAMNQMQLILASASPRRRELFTLTGLEAGYLSAEVNERPQPEEDPIAFVTRLAEEKGREAAGRIGKGHLIIAADTIVVNHHQILGKPVDPADAKAILSDLAGKSHQAITSLAFINSGTGSVNTDLCETAVPMRRYSIDEIDAYISTDSPLDKAGAYGIQDADFHPVEIEKMDGCYANVMGLPLCHLTRTLKALGMEPKSNVPEACRKFTNYDCTVYHQILDSQT